MRPIIALAVLAALAGCGKPTEPVSDVTETVEPAPVETAVAAPAAIQPACPTGPSLPVTGLCDDASPALFLATDASLELFAPKCVWKTVEVALSTDEALVFRSQDCSAEDFPGYVFTWNSGTLDATYSGDHHLSTLRVFELQDGETAQDLALKTQDTAPEDQAGRCEIQPLTSAKLAGTGFILAPNEDLEAELAESETIDVCGQFGQTDAVQFWEGRDRRALFHALGQDDPNWDPASYTFYRRTADGSWSKNG